MKRDSTLFLKDIVNACEYIRKFVEGLTFEEFLPLQRNLAMSHKRCMFQRKL